MGNMGNPHIKEAWLWRIDCQWLVSTYEQWVRYESDPRDFLAPGIPYLRHPRLHWNGPRYAGTFSLPFTTKIIIILRNSSRIYYNIAIYSLGIDWALISDDLLLIND